MKAIILRAARLLLRIVMGSLAPSAIAAVVLVDPASQGERAVLALAAVLIAAAWAATSHAEAVAEADKARAAFAVGVLSRLLSGETTSLDVTITQRTADDDA